MKLERLDRILLVALAAISAFAPLTAGAQASTTSESRIEILDPVTAGITGDMYFGEIATAGSNGTVVLSPGAAATCATTGGLIRTGVCQAAHFTGSATYQAEIRVRRPNGNSITLTGPGGATMPLDDFVFAAAAPTVFVSLNGANTRFLVDAPDGTYAFYAGATLHVAASQAPGTYTGTFEINIAFH